MSAQGEPGGSAAGCTRSAATSASAPPPALPHKRRGDETKTAMRVQRQAGRNQRFEHLRRQRVREHEARVEMRDDGEWVALENMSNRQPRERKERDVDRDQRCRTEQVWT